MFIRCVARNLVGEAAATLRLNVNARSSSPSHNSGHLIKEIPSYSNSIDLSLLTIEPGVLTADVGSEARFSCQGSIITEMKMREEAKLDENGSGRRYLNCLSLCFVTS